MDQTIAFLFIRKSKVLLEYKRGGSGKYDVLQIPQGVIEKRDRGHRHANDEEHTLSRIIYEQFAGTVIPLQYEHVETLEDIGHTSLSLYFVYSWDGEHPLYEMKGKERSGRLRWFQIDDALVASVDETQRVILKLAKEKIRIRSVLLGRAYR